jgi:hypothetical protein
MNEIAAPVMTPKKRASSGVRPFFTRIIEVKKEDRFCYDDSLDSESKHLLFSTGDVDPVIAERSDDEADDHQDDVARFVHRFYLLRFLADVGLARASVFAFATFDGHKIFLVALFPFRGGAPKECPKCGWNEKWHTLFIGGVVRRD